MHLCLPHIDPHFCILSWDTPGAFQLGNCCRKERLGILTITFSIYNLFTWFKVFLKPWESGYHTYINGLSHKTYHFWVIFKKCYELLVKFPKKKTTYTFPWSKCSDPMLSFDPQWKWSCWNLYWTPPTEKSASESKESNVTIDEAIWKKKPHFCLRDSNKTHPCGHCCAISHILCPCKLSVKTIKLGFTTLFDLRLWGKRLRDFKTDFKNHATLSLIFLIEVL